MSEEVKKEDACDVNEQQSTAEQKFGMPEKRSTSSEILTYLKDKFTSVNIGHLLLLLLGLHLFAMSFPTGSSDYVFDEAYYVPAARDLLALVPNNLEHPFFGKLWGALGILLFGDNFFGWRIFYVIIGVLSVWALYELALVFFSKEKALFAASMLGFETLFFIHTSLLLLEGPPILFALLGFLAYFKKRYYWSALAMGLSILSKEWGLYFVGALFLYHVWATKHTAIKTLLSGPKLKKLALFMLIMFLVVSLPLWAYDAVYHPYKSTIAVVGTTYIVDPQTNTTLTTTTTSYSNSGPITNPIQNFIYYFDYHTSLKITSSDLANSWDHLAWGWILPYKIAPSAYYQTTITVTTTLSNGQQIVTVYHPIDWLGIGNLVIWYAIWLIVPVLAIKILKRKVTQLDALIGCWIAATYLPSIFLSAVVQRVVYSFYFVNVDPGLALGIPMVITFIAPDSQRMQRGLMALWLGAAVLFFILYFPVHPLGFR
ncbi:MAG: glycosyltransferase family 39 protein [Thaumarchaeota archaeon]|nr:glycosyltransferase family 39 protein [Nitrososphaerota archaeon]